jgi:hypothetical protein
MATKKTDVEKVNMRRPDDHTSIRIAEHDIHLLPISKIRVGLRHRKDVGDLTALAVSIERGLLQQTHLIPTVPYMRVISGTTEPEEQKWDLQ